MFVSYGFWGLLILLLMGHCLADYPLQGEFVALQKNPYLASEKRFAPWRLIMEAHCIIHAGFVLLFTGCIWLACAEYAIHFITDILKCVGKISYKKDQFIHYTCKLVWALITFYIIWPHVKACTVMINTVH